MLSLRTADAVAMKRTLQRRFCFFRHRILSFCSHLFRLGLTHPKPKPSRNLQGVAQADIFHNRHQHPISKQAAQGTVV